MPMRPAKRGWIWLGGLTSLAALVAGGLWTALKHQPSFYRDRIAIPAERQQAEAEQFVAQSLRLRNDIVNEPRWEASFTDEQINAWLAEDLVAHFAPLIPPGVRDPRVVIDAGRLTLAFQLDDGPFRSVVWIVFKARVPRANELALTVEKIRAGALPVSPQQFLGGIAKHAQDKGVSIDWTEEDGLPVATIRYKTDPGRQDVVLEQVELVKGKVRLLGRSDAARGRLRSPALPDRQALQSRFPNQKTQSGSTGLPL